MRYLCQIHKLLVFKRSMLLKSFERELALKNIILKNFTKIYEESPGAVLSETIVYT